MRLVLSLAALCLLTGFHGCFNEKVGHRPLTALAGKRIGYVDTRLGTGGVAWISGNHSPAAAMPFGLVKPGPDTVSLGRVLGTAGYYYGDVWMKGFSHTRLVGAGVWEGGALRVIPANESLGFARLKSYEPPFDHANENATPGYYATRLYTEDITAELTATPRVAVHRYRFDRALRPRVVIDLTSHLANGGRVDNVQATVDYGTNRVTGRLTLFDDFSQRYQGLPHFFAVELQTPIRAHRFLRESGESTALSETTTGERLYLELELDAPVVELRVALSYVDGAGALGNLAAEGAPFGVVQNAAHDAWEMLLARATVEGDDERKKIFYTALYESFQMPTIFSDADGRYTGFDKVIHTAAGFTYFSDFSLWDTFRTVHPLYNLIARDEQRQMARSLLAMADESGRLPRWASGGGHADSMLGHPGIITIAESLVKGVPGIDANAAYAHFLKSVNAVAKDCLDDYRAIGYCPWDAMEDSVSYTVEYAYADHAISLVASSLGKTADASFYRARASGYRHLWNPRHIALVPRSRGGAFLDDFSLFDNSYIGLTKAAKHYREGSPNHYRWYAPHDPEGLAALFGGSFVPELERFFEGAPKSIGSPYPSAYYWHGNEHDLHAVFHFNHVGRPDLTQKWTRWIHDTKYDSTSIGLDGNDDGGTLSAWYVLTAVGIFPIAGTTRYEITTPLFTRATLAGGLTIRADGIANGDRYVRAVRFNGVRLPNPWFDHSLIAGGGELVFETSPIPVAWEGS